MLRIMGNKYRYSLRIITAQFLIKMIIRYFIRLKLPEILMFKVKTVYIYACGLYRYLSSRSILTPYSESSLTKPS